MKRLLISTIWIVCLLFVKDSHSLLQLEGQPISLVRAVNPPTVVVSWKQGSIFGIGGDRSHVYKVYRYKFDNFEDDEADPNHVLLFCQDDWIAPETMNLDNKLQYGLQMGALFLVLHDKSRTPYQHRFVENTNAVSQWAYFTNNILHEYLGIDLSWIIGDYLRNF